MEQLNLLGLISMTIAHFFSSAALGLKWKRQSLASLRGHSQELMVSDSAGYACQISQPRRFDRFMIECLTRHGLFPRIRQFGADRGLNDLNDWNIWNEWNCPRDRSIWEKRYFSGCDIARRNANFPGADYDVIYLARPVRLFSQNPKAIRAGRSLSPVPPCLAPLPQPERHR